MRPVMVFVLVVVKFNLLLLLLLLTADDGRTWKGHLSKSLIALRIFLERPKFNKGFKTPFNWMKIV